MFKSITTTIFLIISLLSLSVAAAPAAGNDADELETVSDLPRKSRLALFNSRKAVEEEEFGRAAEILEKFLRENPDNDHYIIRSYLGMYMARLENREEALKHYRRSVELEPRYSQGWLNLGETAYQMEQYSLAARAILKGFELSADRKAHLLHYAAAAYIMGGEHIRAVDLLEELISGRYGQPGLKWYRALISACLDAKVIGRGERAIESMIDHFPGNPDAWKLAFRFYAGSGDYRQAAVALTIVGYLRPLEPDERVQLGDMYNAIGVPAEASGYYSEAVSDTSPARDFEKLASAYLAAYDYDQALSTLKRALARKPTVRLWALLGDLHYMDDNYREAYRAFGECVRMDPDYGRAYLMMGYCALEMGEVDEAIERLNTATGFSEYRNTAMKLLRRAETQAN